MSERAMDEAKERKFQERLARISRRRFVQTATLGGVTAFAAQSAVAQNQSPSPAASPKELEESATNFLQYIKEKPDDEFTKRDLSTKCKNTMDLVNELEIGNLFTGAFMAQLNVAKNNVSGEPRNRIDELITALDNANMDVKPLRDFYGEVPWDDWPVEVLAAVAKAATQFIIPFVHLSTPARARAVKFLEDYKTGEKDNFLKVFGTTKVKTLFYTKAPDFDVVQHGLIREAKQLGVLRRHPDLSATEVRVKTVDWQKGHCAQRVAGVWSCKQSNDDSEQCAIEGGVPLSGSDMC